VLTRLCWPTTQATFHILNHYISNAPALCPVLVEPWSKSSLPLDRWLTGVKDRRLVIPPGMMRIVGSRGPQCLSDTIIEEGDYDCQQTPVSALYPLFKAIFEKCGTTRPDHLPR